MSVKTIGAAQFKAECLRILDQANREREPVTITKRGRPVAIFTPIESANPKSLNAFGAAGIRYDDPFSPATDPTD